MVHRPAPREIGNSSRAEGGGQRPSATSPAKALTNGTSGRLSTPMTPPCNHLHRVRRRDGTPPGGAGAVLAQDDCLYLEGGVMDPRSVLDSDLAVRVVTAEEFDPFVPAGTGAPVIGPNSQDGHQTVGMDAHFARWTGRHSSGTGAAPHVHSAGSAHSHVPALPLGRIRSGAAPSPSAPGSTDLRVRSRSARTPSSAQSPSGRPAPRPDLYQGLTQPPPPKRCLQPTLCRQG
jgi:hypothetical protein